MNKIKFIKLLPFKMQYANNGYASGLVVKREITFREANHIAKNILGIDTDLTFDDISGDKDYLIEIKKQLVIDITDLINGDIGFDHISDEWVLGEAFECLNIAIFFDMLLYLTRRGIV